MDPITLHRSCPLNVTASPLFYKSILLFLCVAIGVFSFIKNPATTFKYLKVIFINLSLNVLNNPAPQWCPRIGNKIRVPHSFVYSAQMFLACVLMNLCRWFCREGWVIACWMTGLMDPECHPVLTWWLDPWQTRRSRPIQINVERPRMWYEVQYIGNFCTVSLTESLFANSNVPFCMEICNQSSE